MTAADRGRIHSAIERRREEILRWTQELLGYPSENRPPGGSEAAAQDFLARECRKLGWTVESYLPTDVRGIREHRYWLAGREYPPVGVT